MEYVDGDEVWRQRLAVEWGETVAAHMHIADGFSLLALDKVRPKLALGAFDLINGCLWVG